MRYVDALRVSQGREPMKRIDPAAHEEQIAQETYRHHQAVEREQTTQLARLRYERESWGRHEDESDRFYIRLGTLLENSVRGLVREWEASAPR